MAATPSPSPSARAITTSAGDVCDPRRAHLRTRTTGLLYALADAGPGGATAEALARGAGMRTRQAAARLRWLQRGHLVRYVPDRELWQLTDDSIFSGKPKP